METRGRKRCSNPCCLDIHKPQSSPNPAECDDRPAFVESRSHCYSPILSAMNSAFSCCFLQKRLPRRIAFARACFQQAQKNETPVVLHLTFYALDLGCLLIRAVARWMNRTARGNCALSAGESKDAVIGGYRNNMGNL